MIRSLITGSILALVLLTGGPAIHSLFKRRGRNAVRSLDSLRFAMLGREKQQIHSMLGPPRALGHTRGTIWYYAVDNAQRVAMAILFDNERVREVEFFHAPG